jgi:hypothetical protein
MVEQNTENVWVIGSNPILGNSFDFGEDIKRAALIIHAKGTENMGSHVSTSYTGE